MTRWRCSVLARVEQGSFLAQSILGLRQTTGRGVPQDDKMAVQWYGARAEQGLCLPNSIWEICGADGRGAE
ncbi:MAG: hypothetical protein ACYYK0_01555 [Candidatus Eutrophobiaceae bacterium]